MTKTQNAIGIIKVKVKVYCEICNCTHTRVVKVKVYENTEKAITDAKIEARRRASAKYTCRICKSIVEDLKK